jgi:Domain of unknown function (DUF6471)
MTATNESPETDEAGASDETIDAWQLEARKLLKRAVEDSKLSYGQLALKLNELGFDTTTPKQLMQRVHRGTFSFAFGLRVWRLLGEDSVDIKRIALHKRPRSTGK